MGHAKEGARSLKRTLGQQKIADDFAVLSRRILHFASRGTPKIDFLRGITEILLRFSGCDVIELWLSEDKHFHRYEASRSETPKDSDFSFSFRILPSINADDTARISTFENGSDLVRVVRDFLQEHPVLSSPDSADGGDLSTGDSEIPFSFRRKGDSRASACRLCVGKAHPSIALIQLASPERNIGLLQLKSKNESYFSESEIESYEYVGQHLALAIIHQHMQAALQERVKELTCLDGMAQVSQDPNLSLEEILETVVKLLPPSWQYPDIASARITLDGRHYSVPGFRDEPQRQRADIVVRGEKTGVVEVVYLEERPDLDEGPFLKEERSLIDVVARQVALIVERRRAEEERARLQEQLRHADRLATIGQLAAGVAHELNEPLGNILGFAQLTMKSSDLPEQTRKDIERIIVACLHGRQVIQKLMMFARQTPPKKTMVDLNQLVKEGLYFLATRCAKQGVEVIRLLDSDLPEITADAAQLHQVLVNLTVNALQAMPDGGTLTLRTVKSDDHVSLIVEDTGAGIAEEVMKKIFMPFFTTKGVGEGVGLGLSVVHGIVTAHRGSVKVESKAGEGSRFEVLLPIAGIEDKDEAMGNGHFTR